jgi:hypothetical protein
MNKNRDITKKEIIDFLKKEYKRSGIVPSVRKIKSRFNVSVWFYSRNGMKEIYKLCKFKFSPEENKRKSRKRFFLQKRVKKKKEIVKYFIQQIKKGVAPTRQDIQKRFKVHLATYFPIGIKEVYQAAKVNLPTRLQDRENLERKIIKYIQQEIKKRHYPTCTEIENKFHTNLRYPIRELYKKAGARYKRDPNPFLRYKKEEKLAEITKKLFLKLDYKIKKVSIGPSNPCGSDIIVEDERKRLIPVELKAYQKFGKLGQVKHSSYLKDEITQLKKYIKNMHSSYGYLVTSTDKRTFKTIPSNIRILFGNDLKELLCQFKMYQEIEDLDWIRNSSISYGKQEMYRKIRYKILEYIKRKIEEGKYVSTREIFKKFKVNPDSYFSRGVREVYQELNIDPELIPNYRMGRNFNKEKLRKKIIDFVKEENKKGYLPTYKEIQRKFRCLPKLYFVGGIREIAKLAGIKYKRKFANKTFEEKKLIKQEIIKYTKEKLQQGHYPTYQDFQQDLLVSPLNYFNNLEEIYRKAGYFGSIKKTHKNFGKKIARV